MAPCEAAAGGRGGFGRRAALASRVRKAPPRTLGATVLTSPWNSRPSPTSAWSGRRPENAGVGDFGAISQRSPTHLFTTPGAPTLGAGEHVADVPGLIPGASGAVVWAGLGWHISAALYWCMWWIALPCRAGPRPWDIDALETEPCATRPLQGGRGLAIRRTAACGGPQQNRCRRPASRGVRPDDIAQRGWSAFCVSTATRENLQPLIFGLSCR